MSDFAIPGPRPLYLPGVKPAPPRDPSNPVVARAFPAHPEAIRMAEERRLIARAQSGDTSAFRELVDQHRTRAYTLALRILRSASDAEEVAQDAFVRVWTALPGFRGESSFATWLHRIVARRAFDRAQVLRNRRAREQQEATLPEPVVPVGHDDGDALEDALLQRLVAGLSPAQRAAVSLFYYEGRSVEQVAELLSMPENTVKTHLLRARAALRSAWTHEVGEER